MQIASFNIFMLKRWRLWCILFSGKEEAYEVETTIRDVSWVQNWIVEVTEVGRAEGGRGLRLTDVLSS